MEKNQVENCFEKCTQGTEGSILTILVSPDAQK